ncbi:MAG: sigma-70 family RNA polymerase sigma factor [Candidatus Poribacteria bacterium]|nr:sigma-70 family RNA polymerase sigma factor [Candidatus Poribacteria bacterium]
MKNNDAALIQRVLGGDDTAFSVLVKKYQRSVHALAWRKIGDFHIAEDITQDTFLKAYQRLSTLKKPQRFGSWLYVITANQCKAWLRKNRAWTQTLEDTSNLQLEEATYSGYVIEENERMSIETQHEVVKKLLAKLQESDRTVITLYYLGGMTYEEISKFLGVSEAAIRNRLYRARRRLKKEEPMIREALGNFQITPNLTENIMHEISRLKPVAPSGSKPLVPWAIGVSALVVFLMLSVGSQYLSRFQKPYSFDATSEMTVDIIETPVVLDIKSKPDVRTQLGSTAAENKNDGAGQQLDAVLFAAAQVDREDIPENMPQNPQEHWYNLTLMNTKIGYMYISSEKTEYEGEEVDRNKINTVINLKGLGSDVTIERAHVEYIGTDLIPRHFLFSSNESGLKQVEGRIIEGVAHIKTTLNGETTESEVPVPPDTISEYTSVESLFQQGLKIGDKRNFHIFSLDLLRPVKTEIEVEAQDTLTYQSEEKQVYVLRQTMDMMNRLTTKVWLDADGVSYRTQTPMMGVSMVTTKTDKEAALGDTEEVDIVLKTRILPSGKPPARNARNFEADVKLTSGSIADTIMSNSRQKLEANSEQSGRLSVQVPTVASEDCPDLPIQDAEGKYLGASAYIQADAPAIRAKTEEILDGEINSWRAAEKLCQWVHTAITDKKMSGGFGSSLTALESLSGDCTEHTVLFIALARAAGIPARICSGIAFAQQDAFYYHFWAEVYVGRWVQMDPTWGQTIADANHIQLDGSTLESDTLLEFAEDVLRTLNQLEIAIVE